MYRALGEGKVRQQNWLSFFCGLCCLAPRYKDAKAVAPDAESNVKVIDAELQYRLAACLPDHNMIELLSGGLASRHESWADATFHLSSALPTGFASFSSNASPDMLAHRLRCMCKCMKRIAAAAGDAHDHGWLYDCEKGYIRRPLSIHRGLLR